MLIRVESRATESLAKLVDVSAMSLATSLRRRSAAIVLSACLAGIVSSRAAEYFVSTRGNDLAAGTRAAAFATLERARDAVRASPRTEPATVWLLGGVHRLERPLVFSAADGGTESAPVTYAVVDGEVAEISGARELALDWTGEADGRWVASVPDAMEFDRLFADGAKMIRARYPNHDPGDGFFGGYARDATDPRRLARYANPVGM